MKKNKKINKNRNKNIHRKRRGKLGKRGSASGGFFFIAIIIVLVVIFLNDSTSSEFKDKKVIINEPTKVTYTEDFKKLVEDDKVESVYINEESPILLFTVVEGTKVKQVEYKSPEGNALKKLSEQSKKYLENDSKNDNFVSTYRSFNPNTDEFKDLIYSNNIQVFKLPEVKVNLLDILLKPLITIFTYLLIFKLFFNPPKKEVAVNDTAIPKVKFSDIAGNEEAKEELQFLVDYLKDPSRFSNIGATVPKGILLEGDPGTGKTLLAKAVAGEAGVPFFEKSGTDFIDKYVGVGSQRVKALFKKARTQAPCIIFIDEIDSIGSKRGESGLREYDNTLNQMLVEMDGFKSSEGVILIAATNRKDTLDPALIRPGRFDRHVAIKLPDKKDRKALLELYFKNKPVSEDINLDELSGLLYGFSGASIKTFVNEAALVATRKKQDCITREDLDEALVKMHYGAHPKKITQDNLEKSKLIAYHEVGHALAIKLWTKDVLNKVTIVGTTNGVGGFTSHTPEEEILSSRQDLYNQIRVSYGGRIAEYLLFNNDSDKVTVGASSDLRNVSRVLDIIVSQLGMSDSLLFCLSDREMDKQEVLEQKKALSKQLYDETLESLEANIHILHHISSVLLEKETLSGEEFDQLLNMHEIVYTEAMPPKIEEIVAEEVLEEVVECSSETDELEEV